MLALNRPQDFSSFFGQEHIFGKNAPYRKLLDRAFGEDSKNFIESSGAKNIESNTNQAKNTINKTILPHTFFFGPAGSGKTTAAKIIAQKLQMPYFALNATSFKSEDLRAILAKFEGGLFKPLIFIDEIHRLNKAQQEILLPVMEEYSALIFGASTENPFFSLTSAIRSRSMVFEFFALNENDMAKILQNALMNLGALDPECFRFLVQTSGGDARAMLNLLDFALKAANDNLAQISLSLLKELRPISQNTGSAENTEHYDIISAFIKSIRGSDPNAAVFWLARMIENGENPEFIARRLMILAAEDIGLANPAAINIANSTLQAVAKIGWPESRIILSECAIYLACSPKSNASYCAINAAQNFAKNHPNLPVPSHIRQNNQNANYLYPHDFGGFVEQEYLPHEVKNFLAQNGDFLLLQDKGFEKNLSEWLQKIKIKEK